MCGFIFAGRILAEKNVNIVVLSSDELVSTQRTLRGAKKNIMLKYPEALFTDFVVSKNPDENLKILELSKKINPNIILTVGSSATGFAQENFEQTPIVFSAVKYPVLSGFVKSLARPGGNTTGASIDIPVDVQFNKFKQMVPDLKRVGVLYSDNTASLIPHADIIATNLGLELVAY